MTEQIVVIVNLPAGVVIGLGRNRSKDTDWNKGRQETTPSLKDEQNDLSLKMDFKIP